MAYDEMLGLAVTRKIPIDALTSRHSTKTDEMIEFSQLNAALDWKFQRLDHPKMKRLLPQLNSVMNWRPPDPVLLPKPFHSKDLVR